MVAKPDKRLLSENFSLMWASVGYLLILYVRVQQGLGTKKFITKFLIDFLSTPWP